MPCRRDALQAVQETPHGRAEALEGEMTGVLRCEAAFDVALDAPLEMIRQLVVDLGARLLRKEAGARVASASCMAVAHGLLAQLGATLVVTARSTAAAKRCQPEV